VPGPFGLWFGLADRDCIFYQRETTPAHQAHIILHELGHLIADHPSDESDPDSFAADMRVRPPEGGVREASKARRRTCYDSRHEQEAELIATIILEWASVLDAVQPTPPRDPGLHRLDVSLGHHRGWM
jgi:Zn-dependent peptidase ImmA (M78 family)